MRSHKIISSILACMGSLAIASAATAAAPSSSEWVFSPGLKQTDPEWLTLTTAQQYATTANIQSKKIYKPTEQITVEMDLLAWGPSDRGADGIAISLIDANMARAGTGGHYYSALGYCRMVGAYVGFGLDGYGNFPSSCEKRVHEGPSIKDSVTIRGPQSDNYRLIKALPLAAPLACQGVKCKTRDEAILNGGTKHVVLNLKPNKAGAGYNVTMTINGKTEIDNVDYPYAPPAAMKVVVSASTGGFANNHEIRNVRITGARQCKA